MKKLLALALALLMAAPATAQEGPIKAVASFSILADVVKTIGGDDVALTTLVGPDVDAHAYEPTPADAKALADAEVIFINGLGFEGWLGKLDKSNGKIITVSDGIKPLQMAGHADHNNHQHHHTAGDPHAWQDVGNMRIYAANIATALSSLRPDKAQAFTDRAAQYDISLQKLDTEIRAKISGIPPEKRKIITSHDAFGYLASAYGVRVLAADGLGGHGGSTALNISKLVDQIKTQGIKTVFLENIADPKLMKQIAADTGASVGGTLYADALSGTDGPAPTYIDMMRHNLTLILEAMGQP